MYSWGVGATVDLPFISAMVMGLDDWDITHALLINEERLLYAVRKYVGNHIREFRTSFLARNRTRRKARCGQLYWYSHCNLSTWVICPRCQLLAPLQKGLFKFKFNHYYPDRAMFVHENCKGQGKPPTVIPTRFLVACTKRTP